MCPVSRSALANAWVMNLNASYQGMNYSYFRHAPQGGYDSHRYNGPDLIDSAKLLAGSECSGFYSGDSGGRYVWMEHTWSSSRTTGWLWFSRCSAPNTGHILIVNHNHSTPARYASLIETGKSPGGYHSTYDEDGGAYEFFFR